MLVYEEEVQMPLEIGQRIKGEFQNTVLTVKKKLGEGTQGEVYLVTSDTIEMACKWYKPSQATDEQKAAIRSLVRSGPPRGVAGTRFIWPLDLVTAPNSPQFGYTMKLIDTQRFAGLGEVQAHLKRSPMFSILCTISYQLANSYRALHLNGYCYRDISDGNLMFDPMTGDVLICDNDNVGINRQSKSQVWGTMEYMAPEIIRGEVSPSTETDLHSLAVLLFNLWCWHHPLHGMMEYRFHVWDVPAKKEVYGEHPVFIFDPNNKRNQLPKDPDYASIGIRWDYCPPSLKEMFIRAFTVGLVDPKRRITEGEWQREFLQLRDSIVPCPHCRAENFDEHVRQGTACWHCKHIVPPHPKLVVKDATGGHFIVLSEGTKILKRHISPRWQDDDDPTIIGDVVKNPLHPEVWGIRNLTDHVWLAKAKDGKEIEIQPKKAVPLNPGLQLSINGVSAEFMKETPTS